MEAFNFSKKVCKIIWEFIEIPWFFIMMNRTYKGFFKFTWGLRQSDHILPYLFILIKDILSCLFNKEFGKGRKWTFFHPRGRLLVTHLLYANDLLFFVNGVRRTIRRILTTLEIYESWSDQMVNRRNRLYFLLIKLTTIEGGASSVY